jgi:hypothetical protein
MTRIVLMQLNDMLVEMAYDGTASIVQQLLDYTSIDVNFTDQVITLGPHDAKVLTLSTSVLQTPYRIHEFP